MEENDKSKKQDDFLEYSKIHEEVKDGPSEEEFTRAIDAMSDTDRDIFSDTGIIHVDRDMPAETQAMHVIHLQKQHTKKRNRILHIILALMVVCMFVAVIGLVLNRLTTVLPSDEPVEKTNAVGKEEDLVSIDEASFPDPIFRTYVQKNFDTNGDGYLSSEERNSVIMIIAPQDAALTSVKGIELFPLLQSLTISNTGITELDLSQNTDLTVLDVSSTPLNAIVFPKASKITEIETSNTSLACQKDTKGNYTSCSIQ